MQEIYLGVDVGTSGCKAIAIDAAYETLATSSVRYDDSLVCTGPGSYDQDAKVLLEAGLRCVGDLVKKVGSQYRVAALGFTGQMHGLVALDEQLRPLRPVMSCVDFRNGKQNEEIAKLFGGENGLLPFTNNKMIPSCTGGKILWMKENEPELYAKIKVIVNPKDFVRTAFTGIAVTDESDASGFGLYDVKRHCWSGELLKRLAIPEDLLPKVYPSAQIVGTVLPEIAQRLGISQDAAVIAGAGDAIMQTVGSGATRKGIYSVILGSGGLIAASFDHCVENEGGRLQIYSSALKDQWVGYAGLMSVGTSVKWFKDQFYSNDTDFGELEKNAASVRPGCDGLLFYPSLLGQRNPVEAPFARGVVVGFKPAHTKRHMYRALLEGVAMGMREVSRQLSKMGAPVERIHISGGGAASDQWCQIFADVFQVPVCRIREYSSCGAQGAAKLAANAGREHPENVFDQPGYDRVFEPSSANRDVYNDLYEVYVKLFPASASLFDDLKRFEQKHGGSLVWRNKHEKDHQ